MAETSGQGPKRIERPLSPFMLGPYYRIQMTSASSLLTRITGNALIVAAGLLVWWLVAAAVSDRQFEVADAVLRGWFGTLVLVLSLLALWYHYLAGLRHLLWDSGRGLDIGTAERLGWACLIGSVLLTAITVAVI